MRVMAPLFDADEFDEAGLSMEPALSEMNLLLAKQGLAADFDPSSGLRVRSSGGGTFAPSGAASARPLTPEEITQRGKVEAFLDSASEDEFTTRLLVPFFQRLGFHRVSPSGHSEKALEYGKDLWMKFQLPTGHLLYFGAQVKRDKLDAKGASPDANTASVLNQILMAVDHPVFDPDTGRKVLIDHKSSTRASVAR
jgi:hypothetical protein